MRLLFDFDMFSLQRPRDAVKFLGYALAAQQQGHDVMVQDQTAKLSFLGPEWGAGVLPSWDDEEVDIYFPNADLVRCRRHVERLQPTVVLSHRFWGDDVVEARMVADCDLYVAPRHSTFSPGIFSVPHVVGFEVMQVLRDRGLWDAYLTDDLAAIRAGIEPTKTRRLAGFWGEGQYGRGAMAADLPGWCECHFYRDRQGLPAAEYLSWLAGCDMALDLLGAFPRTYRFAEAVMLGVPVVCVPVPEYQPTIPVCEINTVALRSWGDRERLESLMLELPAIQEAADRSYRRSWSLAAQIREVCGRMKNWQPESEKALPIRKPVLRTKAEPTSGPRPIGDRNRQVLVLYDCNGWAYHLRAQALKKHAPRNYNVTLATWEEFQRQDSMVSAYDLTYLLDYAHTDHVAAARQKHSAERRPLVVSYNADAGRRHEWWERILQTADYVVAVNRERFWRRGQFSNCCCISNGLDLQLFTIQTPIEDRPDRVLWCGRDKEGVKGYEEILVPLERLLERDGFEVDFRSITSTEDIYPFAKQVEWYNGGGYIVCASRSEGTANPVNEGAACGCVAVSTRVGNIVEWGRNKRNCLLTLRAAPALRDGLLYARQNRCRLAAAGAKEMKRYDYRRHAGYYFAVFERLLRGQTVEPFIHTDRTPEEVLRG